MRYERGSLVLPRKRGTTEVAEGEMQDEMRRRQAGGAARARKRVVIQSGFATAAAWATFKITFQLFLVALRGAGAGIN